MKKTIITGLVVAAQFALPASLAYSELQPATQVDASELKSTVLTGAEAYIRTMPPGRTVTAGFLSITNSGTLPCLILSAEAAISDRLEFHEHLHSNGMMRMRRVSGGLQIESGETLVFRPGGLHIMLFNIQQALVPGEDTPLQLHTDQCGTLQVNAQIRSLVAKPKGGMHH